jgi:hypothetical protein
MATEESVTGPKEYMINRGNDLIDRIDNGEDVAFRASLQLAPRDARGNIDVAYAVLQRLQADYLAWKGGA